MFLRKSTVQREPLAVTMSGVRMGERVLQIAGNDLSLAATIAAKAGISGTAAIVVTAPSAMDRARAAVAESGALVDVYVAPATALPFGDGAFDVVVVHQPERSIPDAERSNALFECRRVLRSGGRLVAIEPGTPHGLRALLGRSHATSSTAPRAIAALETAGFRGVRLLADREGHRFIEGFRP